MPLERKPAAPGGPPEYPDVEAYSSDRRGFLAMIGVVAAGAAGYFAYKALSQPAQPAAAPAGAVPAAPAAATQGNVVPVEPQAAAPGKMALDPLPQQQPPVQPAQPLAQPQGNVLIIEPEKPAAAQPPKPAASPQSQIEGGLKYVAPAPAQPQTHSKGDTKAPEMPAQPADPKVNIRGGSGMLIKRSNRRQA